MDSKGFQVSYEDFYSSSLLEFEDSKKCWKIIDRIRESNFINIEESITIDSGILRNCDGRKRSSALFSGGSRGCGTIQRPKG